MPITQNHSRAAVLLAREFSKRKKSSKSLLDRAGFNFPERLGAAHSTSLRAARSRPYRVGISLNDERIEHVSSARERDLPRKPSGDCQFDFRFVRFNFSDFRP